MKLQYMTFILHEGNKQNIANKLIYISPKVWQTSLVSLESFEYKIESFSNIFPKVLGVNGVALKMAQHEKIIGTLLFQEKQKYDSMYYLA